MSTDRDVQVRISFGSLTVLINEEGVSHSPDVLDDLVKRTVAAFKECWAEVASYELVDPEAEA